MTDHDAGNAMPPDAMPDASPPDFHTHDEAADGDTLLSEKDLRSEVEKLRQLFKQHQAVNNSRFPNAIAGLLALLLLLIWASTTMWLIYVDIAADPIFVNVTAEEDSATTETTDVNPLQTADVNNGLIQVNTTIGGLVSALIVSVLSITDPRTNPPERFSMMERGSVKKMRLRLEIRERFRLLEAAYVRAHPNGTSDNSHTIDEWAEYLTLRSLLQKHVLKETDEENLTYSAGCMEFASQFFTRSLVVMYLLMWLMLGVLALIFGVIITPDSNETVFTIGSTWLGTAVMAGYAYFNLRPAEDEDVFASAE